MRVVVLSPYAERLAPAFASAGDEWVTLPDLRDDADFIVSFGHRKIIREPHIGRFAGRMINLHISWLPCNRGADPNFWSWFDRTTKGVTLHQIDAGIDTGPIHCRYQPHFDENETLATSYAKLMDGAVRLFLAAWPHLRIGAIEATPQPSAQASCHDSRDKEPLWARLPLGYDTPVSEIEALGDEVRASTAFWERA